MDADDRPLEQRLNDGAGFLHDIATRMEALAVEVPKQQREVEDATNEVEVARHELVNAELERDAALERARSLEEAIAGMALDIVSREEVIQLGRRED